MEQEYLQKLLLSSAFHVMACDGEIHSEELGVIQRLGDNSSFFKGLDLSREIGELAQELEQDPRDSFHSYFQKLREQEMELVEQFLVIEVILRTLYADQRIDENEINFLQIVIRNLGLLPEILTERFGAINTLLGVESSEGFRIPEAQLESFQIPSVDELKELKIFPIDQKPETASEEHGGQ
jgi:uncharacterized tellurite resistance protein B-like protein